MFGAAAPVKTVVNMVFQSAPVQKLVLADMSQYVYIDVFTEAARDGGLPMLLCEAGVEVRRWPRQSGEVNAVRMRTPAGLWCRCR